KFSSSGADGGVNLCQSSSTPLAINSRLRLFHAYSPRQFSSAYKNATRESKAANPKRKRTAMGRCKNQQESRPKFERAAEPSGPRDSFVRKIGIVTVGQLPHPILTMACRWGQRPIAPV